MHHPVRLHGKQNIKEECSDLLGSDGPKGRKVRSQSARYSLRPDNSVAAHRSPPEHQRMAAVPKPVYPVSVRELVEFVLRRGDLGGERDFVGSQRALAGTRGHQRVQRSRPAGYQKEVRLGHDVETAEFILRIQGRIDGLLATPERVLLEEIKTVQGAWNREADSLHWAQAKIYGHIHAHDQARDEVDIQLTYLNLETGELTEFHERFSATELAAFFRETTAVYLEWVQARHRWCRERDASIRALTFPFPRYRPGQRELAVAAYRTLARGGRLFLEAPTGIGKTVSVLFPALKAMGEGRLERLFYLTARTVGRAVAEKAFADLRQAGLHARTLALTAREKICVQEGQPCDLRTCPLAQGYYDRSQAAMREALTYDTLTRTVIETVGRKHQVCPFELALDLSVWVDAVICDYNYVFDPRVYLRRHFGEAAGDYAFLVDEAHNLVDRARDMFSADLTNQEIQEVRRAIRKAVPRCAKALTRLSSALRKLGGPAASALEPGDAADTVAEPDLFQPAKLAASSTEPAAQSLGECLIWEGRNGVRTIRELPAELLPLLDAGLKEAEVWLARNQPADFRENLLELYFRLHAFRRIAELYDGRYVTLVEPGTSARVRLFCRDPAVLLGQALARGKAAIFFSATLTPLDYYRSLLGGDAQDPQLQLPSPFAPEHLRVLVQDRIRTQLKARASTLGDVVEAIGALVKEQSGNYLVYLPSYQYLTAVKEEFQSRHPAVSVLAQRPGMTESEREAFLVAFAAEHGRTLVGFAVMGGIFGEGIDLVGDRLIGAIVVGVGLPQLCVERDLIGDYFQARTGAGFDYAYTFPGMNRVLQATGRVIRSETDRGVVLLIDARFAEPRYQRLFPAWWQPARVRNAREIRDAARSFWHPSG